MAIEEKSGIQVVYDETVNWANLPYVATLDQPRVNQLLLDNNIPQPDIDKAKITICRARNNPFEKGVAGALNPEDLNIAIYTDFLFEESKRRKPRTSPNEVLLHESKHLINQILRPDYEERTKELFDIGAGISLTIATTAIALTGGYIMLEYFSADRQTAQQLARETVYRALIGGPMFVLAMDGFYALNPIEINARRFASKMDKIPQWQNMLTIEPRETLN